MEKKVGVFAVFGMGAFGSELCRVLAEKGAQVIAVDNRPQPVERIKESVSQVLVLDSTDAEALRSVPLANVDVAVVAMGDDIEASILTTALLKNAGVPTVIARAVTDIHARVLRQVGAAEVLNLELEEGRRIAARLLSTEALETIPIGPEHSILELRPPTDMTGKSLEKLDLRRKFRINVVAIERFRTTVDGEGNPVKEERVILPTGQEVLHEGDVLMVIGRNEDLEEFRQRK